MSLALMCLAGAPAAHAAMFDAQSFKLDNGLEVVVVPNHRAPIITQMVWYKVGSADEQPGHTGLAHMLEHMMFKGTPTNPAGVFARTIRQNGGNENAFTTADYTAYHETMASDRLELALQLEADRMVNLAPKAGDFLTEHQVVIEELRMRVENRPASLANQQMRAALYLNSPYHNPTIGWPSDVDNLSLADVMAFYHAWYAPNNAILIVAGDVDAAQLKPLVEKYFGNIPSRALPERSTTHEPVPVAARQVELESPLVHQPEWSRLYLAPSRHAGDPAQADALEVLADILGDGSSGRLYRTLVLDRKLAVSADASYDSDSRYLSTFGFYVTPRPGIALEKLNAEMTKAIKAVVDKGVTQKELDDAKQRMQVSVIYAKDSYMTGARIIGSVMAAGGSLDDVQSWPDRIAWVTADDVARAAKAVLLPERSVTGFLNPPPGVAPSAIPAKGASPVDPSRGEIQ